MYLHLYDHMAYEYHYWPSPHIIYSAIKSLMKNTKMEGIICILVSLLFYKSL